MAGRNPFVSFVRFVVNLSSSFAAPRTRQTNQSISAPRQNNPPDVAGE
jgi:hypothetical protein